MARMLSARSCNLNHPSVPVLSAIDTNFQEPVKRLHDQGNVQPANKVRQAQQTKYSNTDSSHPTGLLSILQKTQSNGCCRWKIIWMKTSSKPDSKNGALRFECYGWNPAAPRTLNEKFNHPEFPPCLVGISNVRTPAQECKHEKHTRQGKFVC